MHALRSVQNRAVSGAAAQIARERRLCLFAAYGLALAILVQAKQAHHKAGCAEATLRAVAGEHGLLRRVWLSILFGHIFNSPQRFAMNRMRQLDAAINGAGLQLPIYRFTNHYGTRTAVALVAAFFGAGAVQVFAQYFQQGAVGLNGG